MPACLLISAYASAIVCVLSTISGMTVRKQQSTIFYAVLQADKRRRKTASALSVVSAMCGWVCVVLYLCLSTPSGWWVWAAAMTLQAVLTLCWWRNKRKKATVTEPQGANLETVLAQITYAAVNIGEPLYVVKMHLTANGKALLCERRFPHGDPAIQLYFDKLLEVLQLDCWTRLRGTPVLVKLSGHTVHGIGHHDGNRWLLTKEFGS